MCACFMGMLYGPKEPIMIPLLSGSSQKLPVNWVVVKELKLSCHGKGTPLFILHAHIMVEVSDCRLLSQKRGVQPIAISSISPISNLSSFG